MGWSDDWKQPELTGIVASDTKIVSEFPIQTKTGASVLVELEVVGDLGIYKAFEWAEQGWKVVHIPTGTWFDQAVPDGMHQKKALLNWCKRVQDICSYEFEQLRNATVKEIMENERFDLILDKLEGYCRGTKVE